MQVEISTGPCTNCIEKLNEYGKDRWILVYMDPINNVFGDRTAYFMREISD